METHMHNLKIICLILVGMFANGIAVGEQEFASPTAVIESRATALAEKLQGRQDYFAEHSSELYGLVGNILLPGFDIQYASKLVLGRTHWTAARPEQRDAFIDAFYGFLVRTYSKGLIGFDQNGMYIEPDATYSKDGGKALVRTTVSLGNGDSVEINYALRDTDNGWKMYDVRIDGVSYIQNYRSQFDAEIAARGLDAVIVRLQRESEADAAAAKAQASGDST